MSKKQPPNKKYDPDALVSSLIVNQEDEIAYMYGKPFEFEPKWVSVDVELGQLFIGGDEGEGRPINLDHMNTEIYERVAKSKQILLVEVMDNDVRKPKTAQWVPVMVPTQLPDDPPPPDDEYMQR